MTTLTKREFKALHTYCTTGKWGRAQILTRMRASYGAGLGPHIERGLDYTVYPHVVAYVLANATRLLAECEVTGKCTIDGAVNNSL